MSANFGERTVGKLKTLARRYANLSRLVGWDRVEGPPTRPGFASLPDGEHRNAIPVVLCVWQRLDRLERTLSLFRAQTYDRLELHVWNNNRRAATYVDSILAGDHGVPVSVTHSSRNAGGFGRFYLARCLAGRYRSVIFIDDDQTFGPTMVADYVDEHRQRSISGFWAFHLQSPVDYGKRVPASPGEQVKYCGTGGLIADTDIFLEPGLFRCPRRFWFAEDLWLSYYADHVLGWDIRRGAVEFEMDDDGLDQFHRLHGTKSRLLRYLVRSGWDIGVTAPPTPTRPAQRV
jgi:hypothetical protein